MLGQKGSFDVVCVDDPAAVRFFDAGDDLQQCGFARAVGADEADLFSFVDAETDVLQQRRLCIAFIYLICVY